MKCIRYLVIIIGLHAGQHVSAINIGSAIEGAIKVAEVAKTVAGVVDLGFSVAGIAVNLWGSDADKERFMRGLAITGIISGTMQGDLDRIRESATAIHGERELIGASEDHAAELPVADSLSPSRGNQRSIGSIFIIPEPEYAVLNATKKVVSAADLKVGQMSNLKNQVIFESSMPRLGEKLLIELPNKKLILLETRELEPLLRDVSPYNTNPAQYLQMVVNSVEPGQYKVKTELGSIIETKDNFSRIKTLWCNLTNNTFGIFHTKDRTIILSTFISFPK